MINSRVGTQPDVTLIIRKICLQILPIVGTSTLFLNVSKCVNVSFSGNRKFEAKRARRVFLILESELLFQDIMFNTLIDLRIYHTWRDLEQTLLLRRIPTSVKFYRLTAYMFTRSC